MADRTVSVRLQAVVTDYMTKMAAASKATTGLAREVDIAKGKAAQGFHAMGIAGVAMGTVVAGGFALAVKSAADFESRMALVRTLSHATSAQMAQLSDAALHVGQAYGFSATEVADAEAELVKAGVSVKDVIGGALTGALTLAAAGQTNVAEATQIAATAMTQFQLAGKDVPHIADLLAAGADKALGSVGDIGYALDQAGLTAHQFGISIEETIGTLAAFAQAGQVGERGGTVLAQVLAQLSAPSKQASDILQHLGINAYTTSGQFVGLASLAGQLQSSMSGLTQAERTHDLQVIFGQRAIRGANILYQEGAQGIQEWTERVEDQGFAALQAAGKLDSLSGDVTKLKTALQTAFIGVGEGGQGPLRTMVQDVTHAVEVWNELPGPVKTATEALVLAGGAVTFAGGAALLFIPKWAAMNAALEGTGVGAISASRALSTLGKTTVVVVGLTAVYEAVSKLSDALGPQAPNIDAFTNSLIDLGRNGAATGKLADVFGKHLDDLAEQAKKVADPSTLQRLERWSRWNPVERLAGVGNDLVQAKKNIGSLDQAMAGLVSGGHLDLARRSYSQLSGVLHHAGLTTGQITKLFPKFGDALASSATSAKLAGDGVDRFGNAVGGAGKKTKTATERAKSYSDALHALADPLFALNQSLQAVTDAQQAVNHAVHKFGADSPQARQANLDMASAALDAEAAARTLAASVKDGTTSLHDARTQLRAWVADGLITKQSAEDVAASFDYLIGKAETISGLHPHMTVTADTSQPETALSQLFDHIGQVIGAALSLGGSTSSGPTTPAPGQRRLGLDVPPPRTPRHHAGGGTSGGTTSTTSSDDDFYAPSSTGSGAGGGGGRDSRRSRERPPTVQEIVHAVLTGSIPPSIDKLSHVLQVEIRHLTTTVGNAQQYQSTVRSSLLGYASLSNATAPTDVYGRVMGGAHVNSYLKGRLANLKQFVHLRHRLEREGAGQALLHEFEEIGPDANPMMRQLLAGGSRAVQRATRLEHRVRHVATDVAGEAATDRYGAQLVHELRGLPEQEARALVKALRHENIAVSLEDVAQHRGRRVRSKSG